MRGASWLMPALLAGIAASVVGCSASAPSSSPTALPSEATTPAPATPSIEPSAVPTDAPKPAATIPPDGGRRLDLTWQQTATRFREPSIANGLARISGQFVVLGEFRIGDASSMIATSADGSVWNLMSGLVPKRHVTLLDAADDGRSTLVVGSQVAYEEHPTLGLQGTSRGVVVRKPAGGAWSGVLTPAALVGGDLRGVVALDVGGFVAFGGYAEGIVGLGCSWGCLGGVGIWHSSDGRAWSAALLEAQRDDVSIEQVGVTDRDGELLAYAAVQSQPGPSTEIWISRDGRAWSAARPVGLEGVALRSIIGVDEGFLGVSERVEKEPGPTVYRSADGITWRAVAPVGPSLWGVVPVDGGFVGWDNIILRETYGAWTSVDAITWTRQDAYEPFYAGTLASDGRTVVSIGSNSGVDPIWVGTLTPRP